MSNSNKTIQTLENEFSQNAKALPDFEPGDTDYDDATVIFFKDDPRWRDQFDEVKRILATREHVPKGERKAKRIARAAQSKNRSRPKRR